LEIISFPVILIISYALAWIGRRKKSIFLLLLLILAASSLYYSHLQCTLTKDSIADLKSVSEWLCRNEAKELYVDVPGMDNIVFHTYGCGIEIKNIAELKKETPAQGAYIISGGSRMYLWDDRLIKTIEEEDVKLPLSQVLTYPESKISKRKGPLIVYRYQGQSQAPSSFR
jgi:hypothetical protein